MKNTRFNDVLFALLAVCALLQIGLGLRALGRSQTWRTIAVTRASSVEPTGVARRS